MRYLVDGREVASLSMALTITKTLTDFGDRQVRFGTITFDSSYPTNGESMVAADLGLAILQHFVITDNAGADVVAWDRTNAKLLAYVRTTGVEVANATDLSALVVSYIAYGY